MAFRRRSTKPRRSKGASSWRILRDISIPLALPSIVGAGLFAFMLSYSEFLFALFITTTRERRTLPVILGALSANTDVSWNMLMASITVGVDSDTPAGLPGLALHGAGSDEWGGAGVATGSGVDRRCSAGCRCPGVGRADTTGHGGPALHQEVIVAGH